MQPESTANNRATSAKPKNKKRARVPVDHRNQIGRRLKELAAIYGERVGLDATDPDPMLLAQVEKAARMQALAEDASARALRGEDVSLDDVVRLSRWSDLLLRRLRLDQRTASSTPSLSTVLAQQAQRGDEP
jgi:hypothetical protein